MNENFKELVIQAKLCAYEYSGYDIVNVTPEDVAYTEVIIDQILWKLEQAGGEESFYANQVMSYLDCIKWIKKHFGVEE